MVLVMALVFLVGLMMAAISVANIGMMAAEKVRVQNTVDSAAYSAAVMEARAMNLTAYVNRAMVANYNSIAFNMALWATVDAYDHGSAAAAGTLYFLATILAWNPVSKAVADVGKGIDRGFHRPMHSFNRSLKSAFEAKDLNKYIEQYNTDVLSMYQGIVFAATQQVRHKVMQSVANEMDPTVSFDSTVSLAVESSNADELTRALDYVVGDPSRSNSLLSQLNRTFNNMAGSGGGP